MSFRQPLCDRTYIEAALQHEKNDSNLGPGATSTTGDDATDFTRNVGSITLGWRF